MRPARINRTLRKRLKRTDFHSAGPRGQLRQASMYTDLRCDSYAARRLLRRDALRSVTATPQWLPIHGGPGRHTLRDYSVVLAPSSLLTRDLGQPPRDFRIRVCRRADTAASVSSRRRRATSRHGGELSGRMIRSRSRSADMTGSVVDSVDQPTRELSRLADCSTAWRSVEMAFTRRFVSKPLLALTNRTTKAAS